MDPLPSIITIRVRILQFLLTKIKMLKYIVASFIRTQVTQLWHTHTVISLRLRFWRNFLSASTSKIQTENFFRILISTRLRTFKSQGHSCVNYLAVIWHLHNDIYQSTHFYYTQSSTYFIFQKWYRFIFSMTKLHGEIPVSNWFRDDSSINQLGHRPIRPYFL